MRGVHEPLLGATKVGVAFTKYHWDIEKISLRKLISKVPSKLR